jgi:hypothetical protein
MNANDADTCKPTTNDVCELTEAELAAVAGGGQASLTPAQRAAKHPASTTPTESLSLDFTKTVVQY